jgi:type VI secretion system protein ImpH
MSVAESAAGVCAAADLIGVLEKECWSFDVGQMIGVIGELFGDDWSGGVSGKIFFETEPSLSFPASDVSSVKIDIADKSASVCLPMMNLLGVSSPLPIKFSDDIVRNQPDAGFNRDFLSMMQNRLHAVWLDAHRKYAYWSGAVDTARGILGQMPVRSASGLKALIRSECGNVSVDIEENIERWTVVDNACALGGSLCLGRNAVVGQNILDRSSKFRVTLGPLGYEAYKKFLPGGDGHRSMRRVIVSYLAEPLICELEISCRKSEFPPAMIGGAPDGRLGRTAVLGSAVGGGEYLYKAVIGDEA